MNDEIFDRVKKFVLESGWGYKLPSLKEREINNETRVKEDLKINGDDADAFLIAFGKEFDVEVSKFKIDEYFDDEGEPILPAIIRMLTGKEKRKTKELTIGHLEKAVKAGRLDEEVINS
jgi:acyl carrier protein